MTWTPKDTEALRESLAIHKGALDNGWVETSEDARLAELFVRAAAELNRRGAEIARLAARVAELEAAEHERQSLAQVFESAIQETYAATMVESGERIATLEADLANSIPRDELVRALRERGDVFKASFAKHGTCCAGSIAADHYSTADATEAGTFPTKESTP